jgi:tetratricopeptide (TPR) repeat protein
MSDLEAALRDFDAIDRFVFGCIGMHVWRGLTLWKLGRIDAAAADLDRAIRLQSYKPESQRPLLRAYALIGRASVLRARGNHMQAAADMQAAAAIDPEAAERLAKMGFA